jgi:hypothetical protein
MQKQICFAECPTLICNAKITATCLDIPLRRENYPGRRRWSTGNSAPSVVSRCLLPLWTAGNSGTATIRSQRKRAVAILVTGGHRRHPASGLNWGHRLQKRMAPLFSRRLLHRASKRKISCPPIFRLRSHSCCRRFASPVSFDPFQYARPD